MPILSFPDEYFKNEKRCGFHITSMMKRLWASQMEMLAWVNDVCNRYDIRYIMCYGSLIGTVRHKGFIPWDDDIDIAMLRSDYEKLLEVVPSELPPYLYTKSLLPGAIPPKEMGFGITNGKRLDTSPAFLEYFHGCPYSTGIDVFVFDRIPENKEDYEYQDKLIRLLDRLLMLQWKVDDNTISEKEASEYQAIRSNIEAEFDFKLSDNEPKALQILRLLDMACKLCEDCMSDKVENREQVIYYGEVGFKEKYFTDRIFVSFENVMTVPIPRDYDELLRKIFGQYEVPRKFTASHEYPIYKYQREFLYKAYNERGWDIPEQFLEYDESGKLVVDPASFRNCSRIN